MKKSSLFLVAIAVAFVFVSCEPETEIVIQKETVIQKDTTIVIQTPDSVSPTTTVDFEGVALNASGIWNGSDLSGEFISKNSYLKNSYNSNWGSWSGFACSSNNDTITVGYGNQYSVIAGAGAYNSTKFALTYSSASLTCPANSYGNFKIKSLMLTNSTYSYLDMKNGSAYSKKFVAGDWFKIIITGYLNDIKKGEVEYYLSDFRDGKTFLSNKWNKVDLSTIGKVDRVTFSFDSSDKGSFGINTPTYACIDNIEFTQTFSSKIKVVK